MPGSILKLRLMVCGTGVAAGLPVTLAVAVCNTVPVASITSMITEPEALEALTGYITTDVSVNGASASNTRPKLVVPAPDVAVLNDAAIAVFEVLPPLDAAA